MKLGYVGLDNSHADQQTKDLMAIEQRELKRRG